ncbi:hypothetical protein D9611_009216 [Ephemerocybe angulata]|uniref:non-specific serine/threonine protein kinase n=1 Tax=Ephemerocybe angulata TaxID=980116 RepID=A0A8H5BHE0_9AGAR|nr:hypothetical protein D9611_009216 [Tulosesus angulatus]
MAPILYLYSLLFVLGGVCWAEVVNLRSNPSRPPAEARALVNRVEPQHDYGSAHTTTNDGGKDVAKDLELLDIVLVATVDGKFHALNRTSGYTLWSMASASPLGNSNNTPAGPSTLAPLVRTQHQDYDPDEFDDSTMQETYIIEPQSGDIYVMTSPNSPLQRFPFSMAELVDMSPFTAPTDGERRMFIGRKETSLILLELETGKIKATLNSECPPYEDNVADLLDELEDDDSRMPATTEVFIGRTDYHISIYNKVPGTRQAVQNLSFSVYGPNNKDNVLQASYRNTRDNAYIQSTGDGEIMSLKSKGDSRFEAMWGRNLDVPVVAVFDVLKGATPLQHHPHAFVLLQPRPRLQDIVPTAPHLAQRSAFIGMVEETGSLYALSPSQFPLVGLGSGGHSRNGRTIGSTNSKGEYKSVDELARQRKKDAKAQQLCEENPGDRRCLLGMHPLDTSDGHMSRMKRLLEGPKSVETQTPRQGQSQWMEHPMDRDIAVKPIDSIDVPSNGSNSPLPLSPARSSMLEVAGMTLFFGLLSVWFLFKRFRSGSKDDKHSGPLGVERSHPAIPTIPAPPQAIGEPLDRPKTPLPETEPSDSSASGGGNGWVKVPATAATSGTTNPHIEDGDDSDREGEGDGEATPVPGRKKPRRGKRGKKKKNVLPTGADDEAEAGGVNTAILQLPGSPAPQTLQTLSPSSSLILTPTPEPESKPSLTVTDTILGFGSHGTVVFKGSLQGRAVAVKRLLKDFVTLASREVSILQDSDDHPNVIRYYYQEAHANFLYIALELCPASLADIIECPDREQFRDIAISFDPKKALKQITGGLRHLHALKLVHRDIKPQNILVSTTKGTSGGRPVYRMLISDFGLTKRLDVDQTSFLPSTGGGMAAGTVGWRAPEILRGEVKLDDLSDEGSMSSRGSNSTIHGGSTGSSSAPLTGKPTRLTKSVDIFALGCLYYYTLTNGGHPYGDRFEREVNILKDNKSLDQLERFGEEGMEACDLIESMLHPEASERPDTTSILLHPFFWDSGRRLNFLQDASDRFEIMCRDPRDPKLVELENNAMTVVGGDWYSRLDKVFIENLGKFRKYDGKSVQDLLRALRNKKHHYQDLPDNVKRHLGAMPEGYLAYFTRRYPKLFLHVHGVINETGLRSESMFRAYFELPE